MKSNFLLILSCSLILFSCNRDKKSISDCSEIITPFKSYGDAENTITSVSFKYTDEANTSNSSWIRSAKYYSCNGNTGFMYYTTDNNTYIHQDVPLEIWDDFKNAESLGSYYNSNIKNKYRLVPDGE